LKQLKLTKQIPLNSRDRPKLPKYKDQTKGRNILAYTIQAISSKQLKKGIIKLSGTELSIKTKVDPERICFR
jgi:hypothetical protein